MTRAGEGPGQAGDDAVTVRAGRPRRGRRLAVAAGMAVTVAAVASTAMLRRPDPAPEPTFVQPAAAPAAPSRPPFTVQAVGGRLGEVVRTGLPASDGREWVINFAPNEFSDNPDVTVELSIGERASGGRIDEALAISDPKGSDHSPGFHYMQAPMRQLEGVIQPGYGYYVGRPAKITAAFDSLTTVTAHLAPWSADPGVTIFWFDPADGAVDEVSDLRAFDSAGARLPDGTIRVGYF